MFRKNLIELLLKSQMDLANIARLLQVSQEDVEDDLKHLVKSLKHTEYRLIITPAYCRKCGFKFHKDKLHKPSKCPHCYGTWIQKPLLEIKEKT